MKLVKAVKIESDHNDFELQPTSKLTFLQRFPTAASSIDWVKFKMTKMNITSFQSSKWRISFQNQFQLAFIVSLHLSAFSYFYWPEIKIRSFHFSQIQKNFLNMWFIWEWLCDWNSLPRLTYDFIETGSIKLRIWFDRKLWKRRKFDTRQDWITLYGFWESVLHHLDRSQVL